MIRSPRRSCEGIQDMLSYLTILLSVERRFLHGSPECLFTWFDSVSGEPSSLCIQGEKASVLFNLAALHSQVAAGQDRRWGTMSFSVFKLKFRLKLYKWMRINKVFISQILLFPLTKKYCYCDFMPTQTMRGEN